MAGSELIVVLLVVVGAVLAYLLYENQQKATAKSTKKASSKDESKTSKSSASDTDSDSDTAPTSLSDMKWKKKWPKMSKMNDKKIYLRSAGQYNSGNTYKYLGTGKGWNNEKDGATMHDKVSDATPWYIQQCPGSEDAMMMSTDASGGSSYFNCEAYNFLECWANGSDDLTLGCARKANASDISKQTLKVKNRANGFDILGVRQLVADSGTCIPNCGPGLGDNNTVNMNGNGGVKMYTWEYAIGPDGSATSSDSSSE